MVLTFGLVLLILLIALHSYSMVIAFLLLLDNREASSTLAWILVLVLLPVVGIVFYFLFGQNWRKNARRIKKEGNILENNLARKFKELLLNQSNEIKKLKYVEKKSFDNKLLKLLLNNSYSLLTTNNEVNVFVSGKEKFDSLIKDIKNAKKYIHLEYYILVSDKLTSKIKKILIEKAREGVEVRILCDKAGSFFLADDFKHELRKNGVQIKEYDNFLYLSKLHTINYRNHRKIVIIDGDISYIGGMNMSQEYIDGGKKFKSWRDTHIRILGDASKILQLIFSITWYLTTKEQLFSKKYYPSTNIIKKKVKSKVPLQIITSGPDTEWQSIEQLYFTLINAAKKEVMLQSPYLLTTPSIAMALKTAALSGVDVKVMVSGHFYGNMPHYATYSYLEDLMKAGVKVYMYTAGFLHSKTLVVDKILYSVGSANMDVRSMSLNYEVNALIYEDNIAKAQRDQFLKDLKKCNQFTLEEYYKFSFWKRLRISISRLGAPLL